MSAISSGKGAAAHIFHIIDRVTQIDPFSKEGTTLQATR